MAGHRWRSVDLCGVNTLGGEDPISGDDLRMRSNYIRALHYDYFIPTLNMRETCALTKLREMVIK